MDAPLTPSQVATAEARAAREGWLHRTLVAFDQFWNVAACRGLPDETISAHTRRVVDNPEAKHKLLAKVLNHMLDVVQPNHGALAEAGDLQRAETVETVENTSLNVEATAKPDLVTTDGASEEAKTTQLDP